MRFQFNQEPVELKGENSSEMGHMALQSLLGGPKQQDKVWLTTVAEGFPLVPKSHTDAVAEITSNQEEMQNELDEFMNVTNNLDIFQRCE